MSKKNIVRGPFLQTSSGLVYSVTLLSGHIVTNPSGFGAQVEVESSEDSVQAPDVHRLEDHHPSATKWQVFDGLGRAAQPVK